MFSKDAWRRSRGWLGPAALCLLASSSGVHAHSSLQDWGHFASGLVHPVTTPVHVLIIAGLGLLAGGRVPLNLKVPMTVFACLSALALLIASGGRIANVYPPLMMCMALFAGALLALEKRLSTMGLCVLFGVAAVLVGLDSGAEAGSTSAVFKTLLGTWIALGVLVFDIAVWVSMAGEAKWLKVALRIVGSWIVAVSLLILAFFFRK